MQVTVDTRSGPITVQTDFTLAKAAEYLANSRDDFVQSLLRDYRRWGDQLTPGRTRWLIVKAQLRLDKENAPKLHLGDLSGVRALLDRALAHGLTRPRVRLQIQDGTPVLIFRAPLGTKYEGQISVTSGPYPAPYFGRIDQNGDFISPASRPANQEVIELLRRLIADPAGVAREYGRITSMCCFCGLPLSDERSIAAGFGPVCAERYDLPWGEKPSQTVLETLTVGAADEISADCPFESDSPELGFIGAYI